MDTGWLAIFGTLSALAGVVTKGLLDVLADSARFRRERRIQMREQLLSAYVEYWTSTQQLRKAPIISSEQDAGRQIEQRQALSRANQVAFGTLIMLAPQTVRQAMAEVSDAEVHLGVVGADARLNRALAGFLTAARAELGTTDDPAKE